MLTICLRFGVNGVPTRREIVTKMAVSFNKFLKRGSLRRERAGKFFSFSNLKAVRDQKVVYITAKPSKPERDLV